MRIGIFTDTYTPDVNGVVTSVVALENELRALGHEVYIVCPHKGYVKSRREGNIFRVPGMELKHLYGYVLSTPYDSQIKKEIAELNLDIIHVQQEFSVGIFGRILARNLDIPIVYTYHTMYEDYTNYVNLLNLDIVDSVAKKIVERGTRLMCSSAQYIIAPSKKTKNKLREYRVKRPIKVVPTGVNLDKFLPANNNQEAVSELRKQLGFKSDDKIICYVGRIAPEKSLDMVIEAFKTVDKKAKLLVVGGGPSLDDMRKLAEKEGIVDRIVFTDKVSPDVIPLYYNLSDAFVSASVTETQGLTFIEALASGLCVFARREESAVNELIIENNNGFLFSNANELSTKLNAFINLDDNELKQFSERCEKSSDKFSVHNFAKSALEVYKQAIADYRGAFVITQVRTSDDCMKLSLENKSEDLNETLLVSLDDYVLHDMKKDGILDFATFEVLKEKEHIINTYRRCIKKLRSRDRTRKEMYDFMINDKEPLDIKYINEIIETLEKKGYINDSAYCILAIEKYDHSLYGKNKIIRKLQEKGIPRELTLQYLEYSDDHELEKAKKQAIKYSDNIKNKSVKDKQQTIYKKLHNDGYDSQIINTVMSELDFEDDLLKEVVILNKIIEKAYKNYSKKYKGEELKQRVIQYALRKGFMYDDIKHAIEKRDEDEA